MKLLIPLDYLTEACFLSANTDEKKFKMCLKIAQDQAQTILGPEFYAELETQYDAQADTFTTANDTFYEDYMKDYLAWETYNQFMKFGQHDATATGIRKFTEDHSELLSDIQASAHERNVGQMAKYYKDRMINFLRETQANDSTAYPLYEYKCQEEMSWGITSIAAKDDALFMVNKAVNTNE